MIRRELEFFAQEIRSQRFGSDWPLPIIFWSRKAWSTVLRFWFGMLYGLFSDFGRSTFRPVVAWLLFIPIFAVYYLSQSPQLIAKSAPNDTILQQIRNYSTVARYAVKGSSSLQCVSEDSVNKKPDASFQMDEKGNRFTGLVPQVRSATNLVKEAFSISYHNAGVVLDNSGDSTHRALGCLYGLERYGGNPVPYIPETWRLLVVSKNCCRLSLFFCSA